MHPGCIAKIAQKTHLPNSITNTTALKPAEEGIYLWQDDITRLNADAITNVANDQLCGCFIPCHACIDNCIHTYAGIQLRKKCGDIMRAQEHERLLASCYTSCLELAAEIAVETVREFLKKEMSVKRVIFNVFKDIDWEIYERLLG